MAKFKKKITGTISGKNKQKTIDFLNELKKDLSGSIKYVDPVGSQSFQRSPIYLDYSVSALKSQIKLDITFKKRKEAKGRREIASASEPGNSNYREDLAKKFNQWFEEALLKSIPRGAIIVNSEDELWEMVKFNAYTDPDTGNPALRKLKRGDKRFSKNKFRLKTVIYHDKNLDLFIYYSPTTKDQKNSFNTSILTKIKNEVRKGVRKRRSKEENFYYKNFFAWIQSIHLGHTYGLKASQVGRVLDFKDSGSLGRGIMDQNVQLNKVDSVPNYKLAKGITQSLVTKLLIDINVSVEKNFIPRKDGYIQGLILEFGPENSESGQKLKRAIDDFLEIQIEEAIKELQKPGKISVNKLINILSSDTTEELIINSIIDTFIGKKPKSYKGKKTEKGKVTNTVNSKITASKISLGAKLKAELESSTGLDLNSKIPYLNTRLHDKIQQNMGKGRSKQILNYRTGRFARSAEIESFAPSKEKGAANAIVKYMRYPYATFEPGGRLATTPGRDPHRIFGRSIRQLLQEEKIATLRRVKVQLRG